MKRLLLPIVVLGLAGSLARATTPLYVSADVPTTETATLTTLLESQIFRYTSAPSYTLALTVPGNPTLDGIEKMDKLANWLFSVEAPNSLAGSLGGVDAEPGDVIRYDGTTGTYSFFFCASAVGIPAGVNVDALYLDGGDTGSLIVSFDVPTILGGFTFDPADLVRFVKTGVGCGGWTLAAANPDFDASAAGIGILTSSNVIGADTAGGLRILSFDVPTDLGPPGVTTYLPGQIVSWDGLSFALFEPLAGWPISSQVDGLSCLANPGTVPTTVKLAKAAFPDLTVTWSASCSEGGEDYEIYEGTIGSWYSHTMFDCSTAVPPPTLSETITPAAGNKYYLVVARNTKEEGSYGTCSLVPAAISAGCAAVTGERPLGGAVCISPREITPCPPP